MRLTIRATSLRGSSRTNDAANQFRRPAIATVAPRSSARMPIAATSAELGMGPPSLDGPIPDTD